jgi:hypothetical protein
MLLYAVCLFTQVRLFDPHLGGVIGKGTLLPLNSSALPPDTLVLRQSQVKAPVSRTFWAAWSRYWQQLLVWAHLRHLQQQRQWPAQGMNLQQQQQVGGSFSRAGVAAASSSSSSSAAGGPGVMPVLQVTAPTAAAAGAFEAAMQAAAVAAAAGSRSEALRCFNAQDQPWMQQLWYVHDAMQLTSSSSVAVGALGPGSAFAPPPARPDCRSHCPHQQQQWPSSSSSSSSSSSGVCGCEAVLEVVSRPPDSSGRNPDLKINKNLLLLLHHAGVPLAVFEA